MNLINSFFKSDKTALLVLLAFGCVCGMVCRYEFAYWDAFNYHYYNPWAFLNDRMGVDVVPAAANTFFSPFIDFPYYFLINALDAHPLFFCAVMAVPYGLMLFISYKTAALFFPADTEQGRIRIGLTLILCIGSEPVFFQLCSSSNEHLMAFLVLSGLYILLKEISSQRFKTGMFVLSGFILGAAAGLKLTHAPYAAATGITLIVFYRRIKNPIRNIGAFTLAGVTGFLVAYGYWGWFLWKNFGNPVFPFFNSIFPSPYWEGPDYKDMRYFDKPWSTVLFYPFFAFWNIGRRFPLLQKYTLSNVRYVIGIAVFLIISAGIVKNRGKGKKDDKDILLHVLMFWMAVVYVIWLSYFRVLRYMIPFEQMLSIVLIGFFFKGEKVDSSNKRLNALLLFVAFMVTSMFHNYTSYLEIPHNRPLVAAKPKPLPDGTLIMLNNLPSAFFIPFLAPNPTVRAVINPEQTTEYNGSNFYSRGLFARKRDEIVQRHIDLNLPVVTLTFHVKVHTLCSRQEALGVPFYLCMDDSFFFFKHRMPTNIWLDKTNFLSKNKELLKKGKRHAGSSGAFAR